MHSKLLAKALDACLEFGEFLTLKIENMTVQNLSKQAATKRFLYNTQPSEFDFAVVAVAPNAYLQQTFFEMGADVVINSEIAPSAQDFIDAFDYTGAKQILVFPNSSNSVLTSVHAGNLYKKGDVTVLNCRSVEECCLSLRLIDFDDGLDRAVKVINKTLAALYKATIYHATKDIYYGKQRVDCNQFFALCDNEIVASGDSVMQVAQRTVAKVLAERDCSVLTIFYGAEMAEEFVKMLADNLQKDYGDLEIACLATEETLCDVVLAFE
ncbi:MAG: hypothetical protein IKC47_00775 [Clostridia bacterium]|nr:hypothetical protein [Clostridia bacterium]